MNENRVRERQKLCETAKEEYLKWNQYRNGRDQGRECFYSDDEWEILRSDKNEEMSSRVVVALASILGFASDILVEVCLTRFWGLLDGIEGYMDEQRDVVAVWLSESGERASLEEAKELLTRLVHEHREKRAKSSIRRVPK